MSKVSRQHPAFSFAQLQVFVAEDTGGVSSRTISLGSAAGKVMCDLSYLTTGIHWGTSCSSHLLHPCQELGLQSPAQQVP